MINVNCIPCLKNQARRLFEKHVPEVRRDILFEKFNCFLNGEGINNPSPYSARYLNILVKRETGVEDLYAEEKFFYNQMLLELYSELKYKVNNSKEPLKMALKYALAGNIIAFGPPHSFDVGKTFDEALQKKLAVDDSETLFESVRNARLVLYLGDNAGEIVTDKLFIETLNHPNVVFAVRGDAILNDITKKDAEEVGMKEVAHVMDNGFDAPSTLISFCSDEFQKVFNKADVVISKGQGNFEGLYHQVEKPNLFFLFMVKCEEIAHAIGQQVGDAVVIKG
jgi:uncharacterized protein with ATP-grasp and redox domains